jgi:hypothetical protein
MQTKTVDASSIEQALINLGTSRGEGKGNIVLTDIFSKGAASWGGFSEEPLQCGRWFKEGVKLDLTI